MSCDNCDARIEPDDDYLSDDRGTFCEHCSCVGQPTRYRSTLERFGKGGFGSTEGR